MAHRVPLQWLSGLSYFTLHPSVQTVCPQRTVLTGHNRSLLTPISICHRPTTITIAPIPVNFGKRTHHGGLGRPSHPGRIWKPVNRIAGNILFAVYVRQLTLILFRRYWPKILTRRKKKKKKKKFLPQSPYMCQAPLSPNASMCQRQVSRQRELLNLLCQT